MKLKVLILIILISFGSAFAQKIVPGNKNDVNIRSYVDKQIKDAENKNSDKKVSVNKAKKESAIISKVSINNFLVNNKSSLLKAFFLFDASILAAIVIFWRRRNQKIKAYKSSMVSDNIQLIREEKIGLEYSKKSNKRRSKLFGKGSFKVESGESITRLAKKLSISKGEVHLAAKMKMLANS
ncbi:MAG: hypothetical protein JEY94_16365 [Melioribacteraceae bacterium]|nr:hypothetical protein [Melioribacteraceae bacterium]